MNSFQTIRSVGFHHRVLLAMVSGMLLLAVACGEKNDGDSNAEAGPVDTTPTDTPVVPDVEPDVPVAVDVPTPDDTPAPPDTPVVDDSVEPTDVPVPDDTPVPVDVPTPDDAAVPNDTAPADIPTPNDTATPDTAPMPTDTAGADAGGPQTCDEITAPASTPAFQSGCSDSTREGFISLKKYPKIAACGGAWDVGGIHNVTPACDREAGNNGLNPQGTGCNVSDLCAAGWHVCYGKVDVLDRNPLGCEGIMECGESPAFFIARTSSVGAFECSQDSTKFGGPGTSNDLFGCGDLGCPTSQGKCSDNKKCDPLKECDGCLPGMKCQDASDCVAQSCFPLTLGSHDFCKSIKIKTNCTCDFLPDDPNTPEDESLEVKCNPNSGGCGWCKPLNYWNKKLGLSLENNWNCGTNSTQEANNVIKTDPDNQGGVLCCQDVTVGP